MSDLLILKICLREQLVYIVLEKFLVALADVLDMLLDHKDLSNQFLKRVKIFIVLFLNQHKQLLLKVYKLRNKKVIKEIRMKIIMITLLEVLLKININ